MGECPANVRRWGMIEPARGTRQFDNRISLSHKAIGGQMTTPEGSPTRRDTVQDKGFDAGDAAVQANPRGGGQFTGGGERPTVRGTNQDDTPTGAADVSSATATMKKGYVNAPAESDTFTRKG